MTAKKYYFYRIIIVIILAIIFSESIIANNYILPIVSLIIAVCTIYMLKKNVKEVVEDERDYEIAGKAARFAMSIYVYVVLIVIVFLFLGRTSNPFFENIISILAYSVCSLVIIYSFVFKYLQSDSPFKKNKTLLTFIFIIIGTIVIIFNLRLFSGEDDWICKNGQWIKHGNPSFPAPNLPCNK
jgi:uncharacterized membrane protein